MKKQLPKTSPTDFCKAFIERELLSFQGKGDTPIVGTIYMSYWPVMTRMIKRASELTIPFTELIEAFDYSDYQEGYPPQNERIWLPLEHIWTSIDYRRIDVVQARDNLKELEYLHEEIINLSERLASAIERQTELYERSGFRRTGYQEATDLLNMGAEHNGHYRLYIKDSIQQLSREYDLKYWPNRSDMVRAIATFERMQSISEGHNELPEEVLEGRASDIKDFVIPFDAKFDEANGLPTGFRFSNKAMADIINVILDLAPEKMITADTVRTIRNRYSSKKLQRKRVN